MVLSEQNVKLALPKTPYARMLDEIVNDGDVGEENPSPVLLLAGVVRNRVALARRPVVSQKPHGPLTVHVHSLLESPQRGEHRRDLSAPVEHLRRLIIALEEQE